MAETKITIHELYPENLPGWNDFPFTCTYASADDPTFTFTVAGDVTKVLYPGVKIMLTQTTDKFFIVTASAYSAPNTTVTVYGGTDYDLANATVVNPRYSREKSPYGFPLDPLKWTVEYIDVNDRATGNNPTDGVVYNLSPIQITIPIGSWMLNWSAHIRVNGSSVNKQAFIGLSTTNNGFSDAHLKAWVLAMDTSTYHGWPREVAPKHILLAAKTVYYLNVSGVNSPSSIGNQGTQQPTILRAVCAYL